MFPKRVRIGYRTYKIVWIDRVDRDDFGIHGNHSADNHRIRASKSEPPSSIANTLLHEILHGVWNIAALPQECDEEQAVTAIANGLSQVWQDNPKVMEFIKDNLNAP